MALNSKFMQLLGYDVLLGSIAVFYVFMAPYTKVEESFNVQAMHDILYWGRHIEKYDHLDFPGVVPRTFIGALIVSALASPFVLMASLLQLPKIYSLYAVRLMLGCIILSTLRFFRIQIRKNFGSQVEAFFVILTAIQFHMLFYCTRPLPNILAFGLVNMAYGYWFKRSLYAALNSLVLATTIFRCDILLLAAPLGLELLLSRSISLPKAVLSCGIAALFSIGLTVLVDSIPWRRLLWPEFEVFWFNSVLNKSSEWGTHAFHWYFTSALPRSLLAAYPLFALGVFLDRRVLLYIIPVFSFVLLYSKLPHKELRFIISSLPMFNFSAAVAASRIYNNRKKGLWKYVYVAMLGLFLIRGSFRKYKKKMQMDGILIMCFTGQLNNSKEVWVHVDTFSAINGISRFCENDEPWRYSKEEGIPLQEFQNRNFTYLLSEHDLITGYKCLFSVKGFSGLRFSAGYLPVSLEKLGEGASRSEDTVKIISKFYLHPRNFFTQSHSAMLLQPTIPKPLSNYPKQNHCNVYASNAMSFSSGLLQNPTFFLKKSILYTGYKTHEENAVFVTCSSTPRVNSHGTVDYEKRALPSWAGIYNEVYMLNYPDSGAAAVLSRIENEGRKIKKRELSKVVKELRKLKRFKHALEIYEWMNNMPERFTPTSGDAAIQLDLIAKLHGISSAEQYFKTIPDASIDNRIYGSLLNAFVRSKMREKAESLMDEMRNRNYTNTILPFNVMMTLYLKLKDHEKVELLISEVKEKGISPDICTYNIWLSSCGSQGSLDKMEQVFQQMELDNSIDPNWTTFSTMATIYIKSGLLEKAEECLRELENGVMDWNRRPYHSLITLYGTMGRKEEVYRIWNIYKALFANIPNYGYQAVIYALIQSDDIEGAEEMYDEWLSVKSAFDPRIGNLLLGAYLKDGLSQKAETLFDQMSEMGGKPSPFTWEILSEDHIANMRITEALSCLKNAASAEWSVSWKPKHQNVSKILEIVEKGDDVAAKESVLEMLRQVGCLDDAIYMSNIHLLGGDEFGGGEDGDFVLLDQLQESLTKEGMGESCKSRWRASRITTCLPRIGTTRDFEDFSSTMFLDSPTRRLTSESVRRQPCRSLHTSEPMYKDRKKNVTEKSRPREETSE
ncbi:pentatricopeptide repeat-containing protein [Striga asiatica]|uniref:Pentatricopeptide repeat-containing protein n=1 Tax=Striga asiatica TaxID=4170 RepID=A0A5A7QWS2_STRAF|nr:pentatricopeptide repeat-containing protein [Striga asiatica]